MPPPEARATPAARVRNALSVDVEDYFQVSAFAGHIPRSLWPGMPCRIERNLEAVFALLDERAVHATFFTLGWIARRYPALVRAIVAGGHELASHGYAHQRANGQGRDQFRRDVMSSKHLLEDIGGQAVLGYRAPSFSLGPGDRAQLDTLAACGYVYSSSMYPIAHDHYGAPGAPRFAFRPAGLDGILELPISTASLFGRNLPAGGGGYFRLFPYRLSHWLLRRINLADGQAGIFYFHPWELDPGQPRQSGLPLKTRFRHYLNLDRTAPRLRALTRDFSWDRIDRIFLGRP
ncbi:MAG: XrtA system polysaccharide deacetylase [Pseudomonadota bacterium]